MRSLGSAVAKLALLRLPVVVLAGLGTLGFAVGLLVSGSGASQDPPPRPATASEAAWQPPPAREIPAGLVEVPGPSASDARYVLVPGCSRAEYEARQRELDALMPAAPRAGHDDAATAGSPEVAAALGELRLVLQRPCLRHVAAMAPLPPDASRVTRDALADFVINLPPTMTLELDGEGLLANIPPELTLAMAERTRAGLAPFLCKGDELGLKRWCVQPLGYQARAADAFLSSFEAQLERLQEPLPEPSLPSYDQPLSASLCSASSAARSFQTWVACAASEIPRLTAHRARNGSWSSASYRSLTRGWLFIYQVHEPAYDRSLVAYDLATGASYSVERSGGCDGARHILKTGRASVDTLRELAFVLITRPALRTERVAGLRARIPAAVALSAGEGAAAPPPSGEPIELARPSVLRFRYLDGALQAEGTIDANLEPYYPQLVSYAQAGQQRGCAPAKLPPLAPLLFQDPVPGDDAPAPILFAFDDWRQQLDRGDLLPRLDGLRDKRCTGLQVLESSAEAR